MKRRITAICLLCVLAAALLCGCGEPDDIDVSAYKDKTITLAGICRDDITLRIEDLAAMECVTKKTRSTSDKIGEVRATGPFLDTVLESYDVRQEDFKKIQFYAADDYEITINRDFLKDNPIILAIGIDGKPLSGEAAPLRVIIPESDSAYWIRKVEKLEFYR